MRKTKTLALGLSKGFTLVELLVVIAIIGTLATLLLIMLGTARAKARDTKRISDINQMRTAMEQFFDDNGRYPNTNVKATWDTTLVPRYIAQIPEDPLTPGCTDYNGGAGCYGYAYTNTAANPIQFHLWAELEQLNRAALAGDLDINSTGWTGAPRDASNPATTEACATNSLSDRDCIYDTGQR